MVITDQRVLIGLEQVMQDLGVNCLRGQKETYIRRLTLWRRNLKKFEKGRMK